MSQLSHTATIKITAVDCDHIAKQVGIAAAKGAAGIAEKVGYIDVIKYMTDVKDIRDDGSGGW